MQYEHKIIYNFLDEEKLDKLSAAGWQLVTVSHGLPAGDYLYIFRKPVE